MKITVLRKNSKQVIEHKPEESILQTLQREGMVNNAPCGGNGRCGKCKIQCKDVWLEITQGDKTIFTKEQLEKGFRLACKAYPKENCTIVSEEESNDEMEILSKYQQIAKTENENNGKHYGIAVDIGTTTIALQLIEISSMQVQDSYTLMNGQRSYGADVISRMQASNQGQRWILQKIILDDLKKGINKLLENISEEIEILVISANTTMVHLLLGYSCEKLGVFPFTPEHTNMITTNYEALFLDKKYRFPIKVLPGISAFVGGDIMAGMLVCDFAKTEDICILIDLGTNGELAIGNQNKIIVTSAAAGPAFEGGNITYGVGSIPGAICHMEIENESIYVDTIGSKKPCGICGTGVVEAVYELLKNEIIDETGLMKEEYFETGYSLAKTETGEEILLTQKDIREIQLAKAAICAGIQTLMNRYNAKWQEIKHVYLAGGFGYKINLQKAIGIGLLPKDAEGKVVIVGNTSLAGSCYMMKEEKIEEYIAHIKETAEEINLSEEISFEEYYMKAMYFKVER